VSPFGGTAMPRRAVLRCRSEFMAEAGRLSSSRSYESAPALATNRSSAGWGDAGSALAVACRFKHASGALSSRRIRKRDRQDTERSDIRARVYFRACTSLGVRGQYVIRRARTVRVAPEDVAPRCASRAPRLGKPREQEFGSREFRDVEGGHHEEETHSSEVILRPRRFKLMKYSCEESLADSGGSVGPIRLDLERDSGGSVLEDIGCHHDDLCGHGHVAEHVRVERTRCRGGKRLDLHPPNTHGTDSPTDE
jgi:hypothetical protein